MFTRNPDGVLCHFDKETSTLTVFAKDTQESDVNFKNLTVYGKPFMSLCYTKEESWLKINKAVLVDHSDLRLYHKTWTLTNKDSPIDFGRLHELKEFYLYINSYSMFIGFIVSICRYLETIDTSKPIELTIGAFKVDPDNCGYSFTVNNDGEPVGL